jgi:CheY-like chemotaxis protein
MILAPANLPISSRPCLSHDWSRSPLGMPAQWPAVLAQTVDLVLSAPHPMYLEWGPQRVAVYNRPYAEWLGLPADKAPGGMAPVIQLSPCAPEALAQAYAGAALVLANQQTPRFSNAAPPASWDVHVVPLRVSADEVCGVLCMPVPARHAAVPGPDAPLKVLVVEDNPDAQYLVCEMLHMFGYEAKGVGSGEDALAELARAPVDVLLSDVSLPGMSGVEAARQALARQPSLRVVFASGYGNHLLQHVEFPHATLQKPFELDQLQAVLKQVSAPEAGSRG